MKDADKNRCPEVAKKRAKSDARCALRKLGLLDEIDAIRAEPDENPQGAYQQSLAIIAKLRKAL